MRRNGQFNSGAPMTKALVLGGGGAVGIAWEAGLLAGLAEGGADLSHADFIMGTSAGSYVGAQLALGRSPAQIAAPDLAGAVRPPAGAAGPPPDLTTLVTKMFETTMGTRPAEQVRAEIGAWALSSPTISEEVAISRFAPSFGGDADGPWPAKAYACTAVDAADGAFVVWDKDSGIGLARAVASSCAVPGIYPPISFRGHRYIDGGMRSATNADLAEGYGLVIVVAVTSRAAPKPVAEAFRRRFEFELRVLRDAGSRVEVIVPDDESLGVFGLNLMDWTRRQPAAQSGLRQGRLEAARLASVWN
jgi:NTE family protein